MLKALKKKPKTNRLELLRGFAGLSLLTLSASCVPAGSAIEPRLSAAAPAAAIAESRRPPLPPPAPEPLMLGQVAPETAIALNDAIPVTAGDNPAAERFLLRTSSFTDKLRSLECLSAAVYYEAASESDDGQRAVAQVVLNRVRHPTYPNSVCGVVFQGSERVTGCQFSFTCDGSMARIPSVSGWARARRIAAEALAGSVYAPVGLATHYHTFRVHPYWASSLVKSAVIGAHIFYRWSGGWGRPAAFRQAYAGSEPLPGPKPRLDAALPAATGAPALQAELTALIDAGRQALPQRLPQGSGRIAAPPLPLVAEVTGGPKLPESRVREKYLNSGMPRDQVQAVPADQ
jgi:spore germination cell wall hydrolase CwlJ-like protein